MYQLLGLLLIGISSAAFASTDAPSTTVMPNTATSAMPNAAITTMPNVATTLMPNAGATSPVATTAMPSAGNDESEDPNVKLVQAKSLMDNNQFYEAIALLQDFLKENPQSIDAALDLGLCYKGIGKPAASIKFYEQVLNIDPNNTLANEYMGEAYLMLKNVKLAEYRLNILEKLCAGTCAEYINLKSEIDAFRHQPTN